MATTGDWLRERGRPARGALFRTVAFGEATGILVIAQTALLVEIVDGAMMRARPVSELLPYFAVLLVAIALRCLTTWGVRRSAFDCASIAKRTTRRELIQGLAEIGPIALAKMRTGEVAEVAVGAVESLEGYYAGYLPQRAIASLLPWTVLAVVFPLDWLSGLVLVATAVFLPLSMIAIGQEAHERNQRLWATLARISGRFLDALRGFTTAKIFGAARREAMEIERSSEDYRLATMSVLRVAFISSFMLELITAVSIAIVAVLTGLRLLSGHMRFERAYFILLIAPEYFLTLRALGTQYHARMGAMSAAESIRELLGKVPSGEVQSVEPRPSSGAPAAADATAAAARATKAPRRGASVELRDVGFAYEDRPILEGFCLTLAPGQRLALVGPSGAGKSTVLKLLLGFAPPTRGSVILGGREIGSIPREELYEDIAWLPQRPTLFHGTIRYNIGLGRAGASDADIERASKAARVDEFADELPSGLDSFVGEAGIGLSSGQAQRVALARLFLRSPRLVLLDEPTAHLDPKSEELVRRSIDVLCEDRSLILVTHRPLDDTDRSIVVESLR